MTAAADLLRRTVKSYEKDIIKFSRDLIAIPGFSGTEGNVCKRIAQEMRKVGFDKVSGFKHLLGRERLHSSQQHENQ